MQPTKVRSCCSGLLNIGRVALVAKHGRQSRADQKQRQREGPLCAACLCHERRREDQRCSAVQGGAFRVPQLPVREWQSVSLALLFVDIDTAKSHLERANLLIEGNFVAPLPADRSELIGSLRSIVGKQPSGACTGALPENSVFDVRSSNGRSRFLPRPASDRFLQAVSENCSLLYAQLEEAQDRSAALENLFSLLRGKDLIGECQLCGAVLRRQGTRYGTSPPCLPVIHQGAVIFLHPSCVHELN